MLFYFFLLFTFIHSQTIKQLNEISIKEELPIGTIVTFLTDKIPNLEQSLEYDLVTPLSSDLDVFSIDHNRHTLNIKKRIDYEEICLKNLSHHCIISISIAVSNHDTIDVYILPIEIKNIDDNPIKFLVNRTVIEINENDEQWSKQSYPLPHAIDADGNIIHYSLYLQNWNKPNGLFELDEKNLLLKPLKKFDREEQNLYLLRLIADKNISTDIIVIIKDMNDNPPKCQYNYTLFSINTIDSILKFSINVTDLDEGDNGKLEYNLINSISGFTINHDNGEIKFDYQQWKRENQSKLIVNIKDYGKPIRLSTECIVEFKYTFLFHIDFQTNFQRNNLISIENFHLPFGKLIINDKQKKTSCLNCLIQLNSSLDDIFYLNITTWNLYLNYNSIILIRILSNDLIKQEYLPLKIHILVTDPINPSIISTKNYSWNLYFNKEKLFINSKILLMNIYENISLLNYLHSCFNHQSKQIILIDSTNTFDMNENYILFMKKYLNIKQQQYYDLILKDNENNQTNKFNSCFIQLRVYVYNPYSIFNVYPYFSQSFYILTSANLSKFFLPKLPSYVKYLSSKSNEIFIDENNGSIKIQSRELYSSYYYDFFIQAIDSQTPSLSCSIPIRIFFGINYQSPRLHQNLTKQSIEISSSSSSSGFIYQIEGYDPDVSLNNENKFHLPSIEYEIEDSIMDIIIERYTGRIFLKNLTQLIYNLTIILTDFGQPNRLITRERLILNLITNEKIHRQEISMFNSTIFILISSGIFAIITLFILLLFLFNWCYCKSSSSSSSSTTTTTKTSLSNLSPTTPDSRLIDNEYITTTTSLPRVINREQRIYPTISNDNQRQLLEQIYLPPPTLYSAEKHFIKQDNQHNLSINDINKYLERFEKIYNNTSEHQFRESVGSVV